MNKKIDMLKKWCIEKRVFSTTAVKNWGLENFYSSSDVRCRDLAREGFLRSIPDDEAVLRGLNNKGSKVRWYEFI